MHVLIGLGVLAGMIAFAFGENAAKAFVGIILAIAASLAVAVMWLVVVVGV